MRKAKWKPLELHVPRKRVKIKLYFIPEGITEINATIKDLKDIVGVVMPIISRSTLLIALCER